MLKGGKIQLSRECFVIIQLFWGTLNFRSFSHSSQNANISFNRLKSQFFDFLILVSLRTFRGMVYLFWSTPSGSSPHRARPRPPFPPRLEAGRAAAGLGAGWGRADQNNLQLHHVNRFIAKCSINWSATINKLYVCRYLISTPIQKKRVKQTVNISNSEMQ